MGAVDKMLIKRGEMVDLTTDWELSKIKVEKKKNVARENIDSKPSKNERVLQEVVEIILTA